MILGRSIYQEALLRVGWPRARRRLARWCAWLAVASVVGAAAQPSLDLGPARRHGVLELVVDVSGSTHAGDVAPTRLAAVQRATLDLLGRLPPSLRVGLVSFSDDVETLAHPTADHDRVRGKVASLRPGGGTAVGDALKRALDDVQAADPAAGAAVVLLISDGASSTGSDPFDAAKEAARRRVPVLAVTVGTPGGVVVARDPFGRERRQPVPPDPTLLAGIAGLTGGRALAAPSAPALHAALGRLAADAGLLGRRRELALLFAAAALLLLAAARALAPRQAAAPPAGSPAAVRRLAPSAALLVAAGGAVAAWAELPPAAVPPAGPPSGAAIVAAAAAPARPPAPPPFVGVDAASGRDRAVVEQAAALLHRHRELATDRRAEVARHRLNRIDALNLTACADCQDPTLTSALAWTSPAPGDCAATLHMPAIRKAARRAHLPVRELAAMVVLHGQELCLHRPGSAGSPFAAGLRLARKLGDARLFDLLYVQVDADGRDWRTVEQAVVLVRRHGELAGQRWQELRRRELNPVGPLVVSVCRGCLRGGLGQAGLERPPAGSAVGCFVDLDLRGVEAAARAWGLPVTQVAALLLVHEQEHCVRHPDDRETPAVDAERRLARKLGGARLLAYVASQYRALDRTGHWKR